MPTLSVARSGDAAQHSLHGGCCCGCERELAGWRRARYYFQVVAAKLHDTYYADGRALYQLKGSDGTSRHDKIQLQYFTAELNNFSVRAF
jgi:hypothetical protein